MTIKPTSFLEWLGVNRIPNWSVARPLGPALLAVIVVFYVIAAIAAFVSIIQVIAPSDVSAGASGGGLGQGALIVAILGGPFLVWRTLTGHRDVEFKKEGHITDRISKAVEQLGAEKTQVRTGRIIAIRNENSFDATDRREALPEHNEPLANKSSARSLAGMIIKDVEDEVRQGDRVTIQYFNTGINAESHDNALTGEWQNFSATVPNLEVRVGAILALERIAQDSARYDNGRDHPRIMEIVAAYIRENSREASGNGNIPLNNGGRCRMDLQVALDVIGRRTKSQRFQEQRDAFRINIQGGFYDFASFDGGDFSDVLLMDSHFKETSFKNAVLSGVWFARSSFVDCNFEGAIIDQTHFRDCDVRGSTLTASPVGGTVHSILVHGASLPAICQKEVHQVGPKTFGSSDTDFGGAQDEPTSPQSPMIGKEPDASASSIESEAANLPRALDHWSPYPAGDVRTAQMEKLFLEQHPRWSEACITPATS